MIMQSLVLKFHEVSSCCLLVSVCPMKNWQGCFCFSQISGDIYIYIRIYMYPKTRLQDLEIFFSWALFFALQRSNKKEKVLRLFPIFKNIGIFLDDVVFQATENPFVA